MPQRVLYSEQCPHTSHPAVRPALSPTPSHHGSPHPLVAVAQKAQARGQQAPLPRLRDHLEASADLLAEGVLLLVLLDVLEESLRGKVREWGWGHMHKRSRKCGMGVLPPVSGARKLNLKHVAAKTVNLQKSIHTISPHNHPPYLPP